jgi:D-alanine-D-alanine ligase
MQKLSRRQKVKIGLTYDLRQDYLDMGYSELETAERDAIETIEGIEQALSALGHQPVRIGSGKRLVEALARGDRWDLVFNISEGLVGIGREAQVPAILDLYEIPYTFSDPLVMSLCLHKGMTKQIIRHAGLATADFIVARSAADIKQVPFDPPFFAKPVAEGTGMGITANSVIHSLAELEAVCRGLFDQFNQPVLIEQFLPGREFTVGLAGTGKDARVLGTMEILLSDKAEQQVYSLENKEGWEGRVKYRPMSPDQDPLIQAVETLAVNAWNALGCRDGGRVDIRCDHQGLPSFIEVNPLAGLRPDYSDLPIVCGLFGTSYVRLIEMILESALKRLSNGEK